MSTQTKTHFKFGQGDQVLDLTMEPSPAGVVTRIGEAADTYWVRLEGKSHDVKIHARNLRMR